jgi:hypothetical protein
MQYITIPLSILDRIVAVHTAAAYHDGTSSPLSGALLAPYQSPDKAHGITIAATDGKILVEESYVLAGVSSSALSSPVILSGEGVAILAGWLKSIRKAMPHAKNRDLEAQFVVDGKSIAVSIRHSPIGAAILGLVEGTYPSYGNCFANPCETGPQGLINRPYRIGIDAVYMGRLEKLWGTKSSRAVIMDFRHRGIVCYPLSNATGNQRAVIMPISLPD